ncbi:MAG TPA: helix-turn-helix transcriptional regulator [Candidatus Scatomonas merdavium]|nr:helix-turn-helix transcriptional regulator [Candidatus Scatomonas merdavium]
MLLCHSMAALSQDVQANFTRAETYIDAHLKNKISNQQLADICGISISYFIKQFRQLYHMTPQEYIMHRRICKGRDLLIQTAIPIDTISDLLGFCNPSHFIRRFQQAEGMSPTQYRSAYRIV